MNFRGVFLVALWVGVFSGCLLLPRGFEDQEQRSREMAERYLQPWLKQPPLPLEGEADLETLVEYAWRTNGAVRAALLEWVAAVARVRDQAGYPNTNLHLSLEAMLGSGSFGGGELTAAVSNDPMTNLALPFKVMGAARVALEEARRAEAAFHAQRLALREQVAQSFFAWVSATRRAELARQRVQWLQRAEENTRAALAVGARSQPEWLEVVNALIEARNESINVSSTAEILRQQLNALLGRPAVAELRPPATLRSSPEWPGRARELRAQLESFTPQLAALRAEVAARGEALALARLQFFPDINPMAAFTGSVSQAVGAGVVLPLTWRKLQAQMAVAKALLAASQALLQQAEHDLQAELAATLVVLDSLERQRQLWSGQLLPNWNLSCASLRRAYEAGREPFAAWARAEAMRLEAEAVLTELTARREQQLVRLAVLLARDDEWQRVAKGEMRDVVR